MPHRFSDTYNKQIIWSFVKIAVAMKTSVKKILQLMHLSLFQILFFTSEATNVLH